jgi:predicted transcriptional regulator
MGRAWRIEYEGAFYHVLRGTGALSNQRIGELFGISYSSVSHIVKSVNTKVKEDHKFAEKLRWLKSQFKM